MIFCYKYFTIESSIKSFHCSFSVDKDLHHDLAEFSKINPTVSAFITLLKYSSNIPLRTICTKEDLQINHINFPIAIAINVFEAFLNVVVDEEGSLVARSNLEFTKTYLTIIVQVNLFHYLLHHRKFDFDIKLLIELDDKLFKLDIPILFFIEGIKNHSQIVFFL